MLEFLRRRRGASAAPRPDLAAAPERKRSRTGALIAFHAAGQPVWTGRDYAALAREGYQSNAIVHACVRLIAVTAAQVAVTVKVAGREAPDHPAARLLARPNPRQAQGALLEALYGHLMVAGNGYLERVDLEAGSTGSAPRELHVLRPDRVSVVVGADGYPHAYDYAVAGRSIRLHQHGEGAPPVLHLALFHPLDDHYGLPPLEAAQRAMDIHNAASAWNKSLLDNAATPSGALVYSGGDGATMTEAQFQRLKQELEDGFQGARNAGRPILLEGGLDWKPLSLSPREMDFLEARSAAAREIALAFGVPPLLLGLPGDSTHANYAEANRAFWRQTLVPLTRRVLGDIASWLAPAYGEDLAFEPDLDGIEELAAEREALWRRISAADFLTEDEKREALGYGPRHG